MSKWPLVMLGEVLRQRKEFIQIDDTQEYRLCRVQWYGQGVIERGTKRGSEIRTKQQQVCRANEFLVAEIDAKEGGFGIVPPSLDGAIVSSHYFLFEIDQARLLPAFLGYFIKTAEFLDQVAARGSTNYSAVRPSHILQYQIPIPSLPEQQRIVAKLEQLIAKVDEVRRLRSESLETTRNLTVSNELSIWPTDSLENAVALAEVTAFLSRGRQSEQGESEHYLVKTQHVQEDRYVPTTLRLAEHVAPKVSAEAKLQDGDILIACSAAGCLGRVARYHSDGRAASTDTHVAIARPNADLILPDYLYAYLRGAQGQYQLRSRERGDWQRPKQGFRLTELNLNDLRQVPVPIPSVAEQRTIVQKVNAFREKVNQLTAYKSQTAAELDALMPAILDKAFKGEL